MNAQRKDKMIGFEGFSDWSWSRYRYLSRAIRRRSLFRALTYEILESRCPRGHILDLGGGERADYRNRLTCAAYDSVNTDRAMAPTWIVDADDALPCPSRSYDAVMCLSTLEHIFNAEFVLGEMRRALKPGGEALIATPLLYPIHGRPGVFDDFFRPTPDWYREALTRAGFEHMKVTPLFWGPFSTGLTCSGTPGPLANFRWQAALLADFLYAVLRRLLRRRTEVEMGAQSASVRNAIGFFVSAVKPPDSPRTDAI